MQSKLVLIHRILTGLISLAVLVQLLLAGLWHAGTLNDPESHVMLGFLMLLFSLIALVVAIAGRMDRRTIGTTALLFVLILLQPILIGQRHGGIAALSSLHTVNAAFIGMVGGMVAGTARARGREKAPQGSTIAGVAGD